MEGLRDYNCQNVIESKTDFEYQGVQYITMELCEYNFKEYIDEMKIDNNTIYELFEQICVGVGMFHRLKIIHSW